ncbi:EXS family-domain-containing protein [Chiua virens]|nr:EXS family-domain-containing protein [Chiua virens]
MEDPVSHRFENSGSPTSFHSYRIISNLPNIHKFSDMYDAELAKVETFYTEKARKMHERTKLLRKHLDELEIHREMLHELSVNWTTQSRYKRLRASVLRGLSSLIQPLSNTKQERGSSRELGKNGILAFEAWRGGELRTYSALDSHIGNCCLIDVSHLGARAPEYWRRGNYDHFGPCSVTENAVKKGSGSDSSWENTVVSPKALDDSSGIPNLPLGGTRYSQDPYVYRQARRRLREAVIEHYRCLEALDNYRILNLTAFRQLLNKYARIAGMPNIKENVERCTFASGILVSTMLKEMEHLFATRFGQEDRKKAIKYLRAKPIPKSYHISTWRFGLWLGLALPAIAGGSYLAFQEHTRRSLLSWNILLHIYATFVIPLLLALLIGVNILAWTRMRINYALILELNSRSKLDYREYFELPSFLLCMLAYAFLFSFAQLGPPTLWPLIWLALTFLVMLSPFHSFMSGSARWWTFKHMAELATSGMRNVEFVDSWLGDQLCSLGYSISGFFFMGCFYGHFAGTAFQKLLSSAYDPGVQEVWSTCSIQHNLVWCYILGAHPFVLRFMQSLRQYRSSKDTSHLVNAGKYMMSMINYFTYCYWRYQGNPYTGRVYIAYCLTAVVNSIYACAWDFLKDWSVCKPHARYPFLRQELIYAPYISCYYFALISNLCIRFSWLVFVLLDDAYFDLYAFIVALLEMLRRIQWNFYRLENGHLHNVDRYYISRELPLPYACDTRSGMENGKEGLSTQSRLKQRVDCLKKNRGYASEL